VNYRLEFLKRNPDFRDDLTDLKNTVVSMEKCSQEWKKAYEKEHHRLTRKLGRQLNRNERLKLASKFEKKRLKEQKADRERFWALCWRIDRRWGVKIPPLESFDRVIAAEAFPDPESFGLAAYVIVPHWIDLIGVQHSPGEFRKTVLRHYRRLLELIGQAAAEYGIEANMDVYDFLDKHAELLSEESPFSLAFWEHFRNYQWQRMEFFYGYSSSLLEEAQRKREDRQSSFEETLEGAKTFLRERELSPWVSIQIDSSRTKREILREVGKVVDAAQGLLKAEGAKPATSRTHAAKYRKYLLVYDLRERKHTFEQIAKKVYPKEYADKSQRPKIISRVTRQYDVAYSLVHAREDDLICRMSANSTTSNSRWQRMIRKLERGQRKYLREKLVEDIDRLPMAKTEPTVRNAHKTANEIIDEIRRQL
jgi:hypothetical protein